VGHPGQPDPDRCRRTAVQHPQSVVRVIYTDYSRAKGQSGLNSVNILFDLMAARLREVRP